MNISHELPLDLLNQGYKINDYDYCLPHLLDKSKEYKEYFIQARKDKRFIIMDNGLFEEVKHSDEDLLEKINLIIPDIFIVPDRWDDTYNTLKLSQRWYNYKEQGLIPSKVELMVVMQGLSYEDFILLINETKKIGYKHFAFNHLSKAYNEQNCYSYYLKEYNKLYIKSFSRVFIIESLLNKGILNKNDYIHLLGCLLPQEFVEYTFMDDVINSLDTSNPIILGSRNIRYELLTFSPNVYIEYGIDFKISLKIDDIFNEKFNQHQLNDIFYNIEKFRENISFNRE